MLKEAIKMNEHLVTGMSMQTITNGIRNKLMIRNSYDATRRIKESK